MSGFIFKRKSRRCLTTTFNNVTLPSFWIKTFSHSEEFKTFTTIFYDDNVIEPTSFYKFIATIEDKDAPTGSITISNYDEHKYTESLHFTGVRPVNAEFIELDFSSCEPMMIEVVWSYESFTREVIDPPQDTLAETPGSPEPTQ